MGQRFFLLRLVACAALFVLCTAKAGTVSSAVFPTTPFAVQLFRRHIGPQRTDLNISAPLSVYRDTRAPTFGAVDCAAHRGSVVYVDAAGGAWSQLEEFNGARAFQACGALAVLRALYPPFGVRSAIGFHFYLTDHNCCKSRSHEVQVPLLVVQEADLLEASHLALQQGNVSVEIRGLDDNPWVDMFHHPAFTAAYRVLLPAVNVVVVLIAVRALLRHRYITRLAKHKRRKSVSESMRPHICVALVCQIFGCAIRVAYTATSPLSCNSVLNFQEQTTLVNLSMPVQLPSVFVVSAMCRRIISMRRWVDPPPLHWSVPTALYCFLVFVLELVGGLGRAYSVGSTKYLKFGVVLTVATLVLSVLFAGLPFALRMNESRKVRAKSSSLSKDRFVKGALRGFAMLVLETVVVLVLVAAPSVAITPIGIGILMWLYQTALTLAALFFTLAFSPSARKDPEMTGPVALFPVDKGLANRSHGEITIPAQPCEPSSPGAAGGGGGGAGEGGDGGGGDGNGEGGDKSSGGQLSPPPGTAANPSESNESALAESVGEHNPGRPFTALKGAVHNMLFGGLDGEHRSVPATENLGRRDAGLLQDEAGLRRAESC